MSERDDVDPRIRLASLRARYDLLCRPDFQIPDRFERLGKLWAAILRAQEEIDRPMIKWQRFGF
jgi:hypothetical protein